MSSPRSPMRLLLVEDNPGDVRLAREALRPFGTTVDLQVVANGEDAVAFLRRIAPYDTAPPPDLVLLDLNLPRCSGKEVLAQIKSDAILSPIPVVVVSSSNAPHDVGDAYRLGANCYIVKPTGLSELEEMYRAIELLWFGVATLPSRV